jgi:formylglycine-generating enzyme required for sulfatase activity
LLEWFGGRLRGECVLVTADCTLADDLGVRGAVVDEFFSFLQSEFGYRPDDARRRWMLSRATTVADAAGEVRTWVETTGRTRPAPPPSRRVPAVGTGSGPRRPLPEPEPAPAGAVRFLDEIPPAPVRVIERPAADRATEPPPPAEPIRFEPSRHEPEPPAPPAPEPLLEIRPAETRPAETRPAETRPVETRPVETRPVESRPAESRPAESRPAETRPPEPRLPERRPVGRGGNGARGRTPMLDAVAFTQKRGAAPTPEEWLAGPLYEPCGKTPEGFAQYLRLTDGMRCVAIPAAEVEIGADSDVHRERGPAHTVRIRKFLIDAEPVSTSAFARFLNAVGKVPDDVLLEWFGATDRDNRGSTFPLSRSWLGGWAPEAGLEMQPMVLVSWFGANAYSLWANRWDWRYYNGSGTVGSGLADKKMPAHVVMPSERDLFSCLPTEAQWEYAARGAKHRPWPWGTEPPTPERVCIARRLDPDLPNFGAAADGMVNVRLGVSPFGLHHMAGHVRQWCRDWYDANFYSTAAARKADPCNREGHDAKSERGGGGGDLESLQPCSHRRGRSPHARGRFLGFRCVGSAEEL